MLPIALLVFLFYAGPFSTRAVKMYVRESLLWRQRHENLRAMLRFVAEKFDEGKMDWWLEEGALIGFERSGSLIPWDDDVDVWLHLRHKSAFNSMKGGMHVAHECNEQTQKMGVDSTRAWRMDGNSFTHCRHPQGHLDVRFVVEATPAGKEPVIFEVHPSVDWDPKKSYTVPDVNGSFVMQALQKFVYPLRRAEFLGINISVPGDVVGLLTWRYGDFRTPRIAKNENRYDGNQFQLPSFLQSFLGWLFTRVL